MKKSCRFLKNSYFLGVLIALVLVVSLSWKGNAEEARDEALPDLESTDSPRATNDDDSLMDLEKVITEENGKDSKGEIEITDQKSNGDADIDFDNRAKDVQRKFAMEPSFEEKAKKALPSRPLDGNRSKGKPVADLDRGTVSFEKNLITNVEFKMEKELSRIVISSQSSLKYREEKNPTLKQVIYFFENTETLQKLQRAYDTSEFLSPVSLFTLFQLPGQNVTKLIVQLREENYPQILPTVKNLILEFGEPTKKQDPKLQITDEEGSEATEENIYASQKTFSGKKISKLEIKNSDVQDVLRLIAKTSGFNIVVGDDVQGKVGTLSLNDIPWDQAFTLVLQSKRLGYIRQGNVIRVSTLTNLKSEKDEAIANEQAKIKVENLKTLLIPVSYAKAADLANRAKSFLTERGTVETDTRTNTVIIKDIDKVVVRVQKLLAALDTQPPRVAISARIVEMLSSFVRSVGFSDLSFNQNFAGLNIAETMSLAGTGGKSITTIRAANLANLLGTFQIGEAESKVKVLANPSVTVVANQQATVSQGISFFVPVSQVANGTLVTTVQQITATLNLDVTPIVSGDGSIFMNVSVRNEIPRVNGANTQIDTRNIQTQVLVENGDTAVIGGVFNNTINTSKEGVPFLRNLPILSLFFSRSSLNDTKNEIFVFLTAKILNAEESFKRTL